MRDDFARLHELLSTMEVPEKRRQDYGWLMRNLLINNGAHPDVQEAAMLARRLHRVTRAVEAMELEAKRCD